MAARPTEDGNQGMRSARYWQDRAEEARSRAEGMRDDYAKKTLLGIAHMYDLMARRAAEREGNPDKSRD